MHEEQSPSGGEAGAKPVRAVERNGQVGETAWHKLLMSLLDSGGNLGYLAYCMEGNPLETPILTKLAWEESGS